MSKILIVEDESIIANNMAEVIKSMGHEVVDMVASVTKAIFAIAKFEPDLILLDIKLKGEESGIDLAAMLRKGSNIPIIFVTGNGDEKTIHAALETGPYGYILKPIREKELIINVEVALKKYHLQLNQEKLSYEVHQMSRVNELAVVAGSLIHDVLAPLESIRHDIEKMGLENSKILNNVNHALSIVVESRAKLRGLEKIEEPGKHAMSDLISQSLKLVDHIIKRHNISIKAENLDVLIRCNKLQTIQVIVNLLRNACDAIENLPVKWISLDVEILGSVTSLKISDSGGGVPSAQRAKLFTMFASTKGPVKGTGLGLYLSQKMMNAMGGDLKYNEKSDHTEFQVLFS